MFCVLHYILYNTGRSPGWQISLYGNIYVQSIQILHGFKIVFKNAQFIHLFINMMIFLIKIHTILYEWKFYPKTPLYSIQPRIEIVNILKIIFLSFPLYLRNIILHSQHLPLMQIWSCSRNTISYKVSARIKSFKKLNNWYKKTQTFFSQLLFGMLR